MTVASRFCSTAGRQVHWRVVGLISASRAWSAGVVVLALAVALAIAACGQSSPSASPTPTSTATAAATAPSATPTSAAESFSAFTDQLDAALARGDAAFVTGRFLGTPYTCAAADVGGQPGGPVCDFAGQQFDAFPVANWKSEGGSVPVATAEHQFQQVVIGALPAASDEFGGGGARVYATGVVDGAQATVLTALVNRPANFAGDGPLRVAEVISWKEHDGQWAAIALLNASILPQDLLTPTADGRSLVQGWKKFVSASSP